MAWFARVKKNSERDKNRKVDGEEEKKKKPLFRQKRGVAKKKVLMKNWCSGGSTHDNNQEGSETRPLDHKYLRKVAT